VRWLRNAHVAEHFRVEKPTQKLQSFFSRWSIKFSAEYYEAKEQQASDVLSLKQQRAANAEVIVNLKTAPILLLLGCAGMDCDYANVRFLARNGHAEVSWRCPLLREQWKTFARIEFFRF
jgi:hypothetical protein